MDGSTVYADFLNNANLKSKLDNDLKILLFKNGYPPQWNNETVNGVMEQVVNYKSNQTPVHTHKPSTPILYDMPQHERGASMVAEDILIYGSVEVRLKNTTRSELLAGKLDLVLMYAISPAAREKTEQSGRIALGIKEANLSEEAVKAFRSVKYILFHYWKNSEAKTFALTAQPRLVSKAEVPDGFLFRQEKDTKQFLLIEYSPNVPADMGSLDILKAQRRGSNRYLPFVCTVKNIQE